MKLYKIFQMVNDNYDTYDSAIVAADSEEDAKTIHPAGKWRLGIYGDDYWDKSSWTSIENVQVEEIGEAISKIKRGIIVASYNAG